MSQENVEIVRGAWEAFTCHDNKAALGFYDRDVELHGHVDGSIYRGLTGVRDFFRDWLGAWEEFSTDVEEWIDAGDDVIAVVHARARGKRSGVQVERREWHVWTVRDGKLWRLRIYDARDEALEAVGAVGVGDVAGGHPRAPNPPSAAASIRYEGGNAWLHAKVAEELAESRLAESSSSPGSSSWSFGASCLV